MEEDEEEAAADPSCVVGAVVASLPLLAEVDDDSPAEDCNGFTHVVSWVVELKK